MRLWKAWKRCKARVCEGLRQDCGQGTLEFCLVTVAFLAVVLGAWSILKIFSADILTAHAISSSSHSLSSSITGILADVFSV